MTTITFQSQGSRVIGFDVQGHSGYAEAGADIVCAAVTSAVRLVETTVNDVLGLAASVKVRESDASPSGCREASARRRRAPVRPS